MPFEQASPRVDDIWVGVLGTSVILANIDEYTSHFTFYSGTET